MSSRTKILIVFAGLLLVLAGTVIIHHYRVKGAVKRYKAELLVQGEPLQWDEIAPPSLRPEDNSARLFTKLAARLPQTGVLATNLPPRMEMITQGTAAVGWAQPWVGSLGSDYSNSWAEVLADYEQQKDLLEEFQPLIEQPAIDHHLDYALGDMMPVGHLSRTKTCATRLGSASACELHLGNPNEAIPHVRAMLAITKASTHELTLISQLVRTAIANIAGTCTWDLLQAEGMSDEGLEALQEDWAELEFLLPCEKVLLMERATSLSTIESMRQSSAEFGRMITPWGGGGVVSTSSGNIIDRGWKLAQEGVDHTKDGLTEAAWRTSWSYTDELRMLKGHQAYLEVVRLAIADGFANNAIKLELKFKKEGRIPEDSGSSMFFGEIDAIAIENMFSDGISVYEKVFAKVLMAEVHSRTVVVAIALKRYRMRHGSYPSTLNELVPDFMEIVPNDTIDGRPLRYQPLENGSYLLYSIGNDLVDDGGSPEHSGRSLWWGFGRDWVWPQPASADEVQTYWEHEIRENFDQRTGNLLPTQNFMMDPNTGVPLVDPKTGEFVMDSSSTNKPVPDAAEFSEEEWQDFVQNLSREWTEQYFRTLTNAASTVEGRTQ